MEDITTLERKKIIFDACNAMHDNIIDDFTLNPYKDKFKHYKIKDIIYFVYTFENKKVIRYEFISNKTLYLEFNYKNEDFDIELHSENIVGKHYRLVEHILENNKDRIQTSNIPLLNSGNNTTGNKNKDKYNNIVRLIKLKVSEINSLTKNDVRRNSLTNELNNYKSMADKLRKLF
jgi:hypothetical protein